MKVLCVQAPRTGIENADSYISKLASEIGHLEFDLMVLPEKWVTTHVSPESEVWGNLLSSFQDISRNHNCMAVPGSFSLFRESGLYNSAPVLVKGKLEGYQDKISLYRGEKGKYQTGNEIRVFNAGETNFSVPVCYDLDFPYFTKIAVDMGADFLVNPSLITSNFSQMWYIYVKGRSLENRLPVVSVNSLSEPFYGGSIVTSMHPEDGGILLKEEIMGREHYKIIETNSNELRDHARYRKAEDPGTYGLNSTQ